MIKIRKEDLEKRVRDLLKFGLTEYQAKVFVGVLALSEATATELVSLIDVPKARIYQILNELLEMGLIRKKLGRPSRYLALRPDIALTNMLNWKKEKNRREVSLLDEIKKDLVLDLGKLFGSTKPIEKRKYFLEVIPAGEISEIETKRMYGSAKKEICILTSVFEYLPRVLSELKNAGNRGVKIKILFLDPKKLDERSGKIQREVIGILNDVKNINIKFSEEMPLRGSVIDSKLVIFSIDEKKSLPFQKEVVISKNENMARALGKYFDLAWKELIEKMG